VNNLLKVLALKENDIPRVVFVNDRKEGGINAIFNPENDQFEYQVFIHSHLPFRDEFSDTFAEFAQARSFAARYFSDWEMLSWDLKTRRPCEEGGKECGSGECDTCVSIKAEGGDTPIDVANSAASCGACGGA